MKYAPQPIWEGESVVIICGGPSLEGFPFSVLREVRTIGCNDAYHLGFPIVDMCLFVDTWWWQQNKREINNNWKDSGIMFASVNATTYEEKVPHLYAFKKMKRGTFPENDEVPMNNCSGAAAVAVAYVMGAKEVFLLGSDCKFQKILHTRWHLHNARPMKDSAGGQFIKGFAAFEKERAVKAPDFKVTNVVNGDSSDLEVFPKIQMKEFMDEVLPKLIERNSDGQVSEETLPETECDSMDETVYR